MNALQKTVRPAVVQMRVKKALKKMNIAELAIQAAQQHKQMQNQRNNSNPQTQRSRIKHPSVSSSSASGR